MAFKILIWIFLFNALTGEDLARVSAKIKAGNKEAFRRFFEAFYGSLIRFLISRNISRALAEDLSQQAFLYIWENREKIDTEKSLKSYLYTIAYSRMLNAIKKDERMSDQVPVEDEAGALDDPEQILRHKELSRVVEAGVSKMPTKRKMVFELCFMQELSYAEAAEVLEISRNTVENHMTAAFKQLRTFINTHYKKN